MDAENVYGSGFYEKLSSDLKDLIPDSRGLSPRNLRYMKRLFLLDISIYRIFPQIVENFPQIGEDLVNTLPRDLKESKTNLPQIVADLVNTHVQPLDELASIPWGHIRLPVCLHVSILTI